MTDNAFAPEFLDRLADHDEAATSRKASTAGPWRAVALGPDRWGVLQGGDAEPYGVFRARELALLAAAMIPAAGREPRLVVFGEAAAEGFPVGALHAAEERVEIQGWLSVFDEDAADCINNGLHLVASPASLALVLEAAGPTALRRAGAILAERLKARAGEQQAGPGSAQEAPGKG
jgi:hypothetical protein